MVIKVIQVILYSLALLYVLVSCQKEVEIAPIEENVPLQVGNEWTYQVSDYDTLGNVLSTHKMRRAVLKDTLINKSTWYKLTNGSIVQNSSDGYVYYNVNSNQPVMIYQSANYGGIGYMYEYPNYNLYVLTTRTYELKPIINSVLPLSGYTFQIKREHTQKGNSSKFTFKQDDHVSPGVGLVRSDIYFIDSEKIMRRLELISFNLR